MMKERSWRHGVWHTFCRASHLMSVLAMMAILVVSGMATTALAAKLRISYLPIADCITYFAAKDRGFFAAEGLEIDAKIIGGGVAALPAAEGGSIDIGWSDSLALVNAHSKGFDVQYLAPGGPLALAPNHVGVAWMARADDAGIASIKDLAGKKVSVITLAGIADLGLRVMLAKAGVSYKSLTILEVPYPQITPAITQGRIDLGAQVEPFATLMQMKKAGKVVARGIFGGELGPRYLIAGWFAKKSWIAKHTETAKAFVRAITKAVNYVNAHPDEVPSLIAANTRLKAPLVKRIVLSAHEATIRTADLQPIIDAAARHGMIKKAFAARDIVADIAPRR